MEVLANTLVVIILKIQVYQINKYTSNLHSVVLNYILINLENIKEKNKNETKLKSSERYEQITHCGRYVAGK